MKVFRGVTHLVTRYRSPYFSTILATVLQNPFHFGNFSGRLVRDQSIKKSANTKLLCQSVCGWLAMRQGHTLLYQTLKSSSCIANDLSYH